jgi:microtubule-associated protein, RP/EB family
MDQGRGQAEMEALNEKVGSLAEELAVVQHKRGEVESERDFYFSKLREIELLCQAEGLKEQWPIMQAVENILYAATEAEGTQERQSTMSKWTARTL